MLIKVVIVVALASWSLVAVDTALCPDANIVSPCTCSSFGSDRVSLNCYNKALTDARIDLILEVFDKDPTYGPLGQIDLSYNSLLTRVPSLIQSFTQLGSSVGLGVNSITSIGSGAFNFLNNSNPIRNLYLDFNKLTTIAPNAFKGVKAIASNTLIALNNNQLTRFESPVFKMMLEKLYPFGGYPNARIDVTANPFNCSDCHLAWLIRDARNLLLPLVGGVCANGTTFGLLNSSGYASCPSFICPLGYDGNYPDPRSCANYYTCIGGEAYLTNCPNGLVFNPEENRCDQLANVPSCQ